MIYDLHTHSNVSDGSLSPDALVRLAMDNAVDVLAITDHDTTAAYDRVTTSAQASITLIRGVELSTTWAGHGIHIVGLNIDVENATLSAGIARQQQIRLERGHAIAQRLTRLGIDNPFESVQAIAGNSQIGRPHFARHLVDTGVVKDAATAFRKYLGPGKIGDVSHGWASLEDVVDWIRTAGGTAVLAHPSKYKLTATKLRLLLADFVAAGGQAIEVVCGQQQHALTKRLAGLADDFGLAASTGSDFHHPELKWSQPGRFAQLPVDLPGVWELW